MTQSAVMDSAASSAGRAGQLALIVQELLTAIVRLPPPQLTLPSVTSPSSQLDVQVDTDSASVPPAYRFRIANRSTSPSLPLRPCLACASKPAG